MLNLSEVMLTMTFRGQYHFIEYTVQFYYIQQMLDKDLSKLAHIYLFVEHKRILNRWQLVNNGTNWIQPSKVIKKNYRKKKPKHIHQQISTVLFLLPLQVVSPAAKQFIEENTGNWEAQNCFHSFTDM